MTKRTNQKFDPAVSVAALLTLSSIGLVMLLPVCWWLGEAAISVAGWLVATWKVLA